MAAPLSPGLTGRFLVLFEEGADAYALDVEPERMFRRLGVAVFAGPADRLSALTASPGVLAVEPEGQVFALETATAQVPPVDETRATWGLQVTNTLASRFTGEGVGLAVLDTGLDLAHPDFADREIVSQSFVEGEEVDDGQGHGTHCAGTAAGPAEPAQLPRYGVAPGARLHVGKVLSNAGSGTDADNVAGIEWAIEHDCRVVSMSLGRPTAPGERFSQVFEAIGSRAQAAGTAIIAAAGNESARDRGVFAPVSHPANCPSITAVGAVDVNLQIAPFSARGIDPAGGQVDVVGPGVAVHSSWRLPDRYRTLSGTSMATPHAAGILALLAEATPSASATELLGSLTRTARRLPLPSVDVGSGLVQAP